MQFPQATIIIFVKAPVLGQVKTRLAQTIGDEQALTVHQALMIRTFDVVLSSSLAQVCCYTTCPDHKAFDEWKKKGITFYQQMGTDLGERMFHAISSELNKYSQVLLLGTDCPVFESSHFLFALDALKNESDAVIIPSDDGGYVSIGFNRNSEKKKINTVFQGIHWGGETVLAQTQKKFHRLGLCLTQLTTLWDIDTLNDWQRWKRELC